MQRNYLTAALIVATAMSAVPYATADHEKGHYDTNQLTASEFIGKKVRTAQDEDVGKIHDLILSLDGDNIGVPYAVIAHGGVLGAGRTKTAVPMSSLSCSGDSKSVVFSGTKEQLQAAGRGVSSEWSSATNAHWARSVDGFYGRPYAYSRTSSEARDNRDSRDARDLRDRDETRRYVKDPQPKGAEVLARPEDEALCERICEATDTVQVRVLNGVTHLYGTVQSEAARDNLEAKVRSVQGVQKVESHLKIKNP